MIIELKSRIERYEIKPSYTKTDPSDPINKITVEESIELTGEEIRIMPVYAMDIVTWIKLPESDNLHVYLSGGAVLEYAGDQEEFENLFLKTIKFSKEPKLITWKNYLNGRTISADSKESIY